jgi:hypothetical protein
MHRLVIESRGNFNLKKTYRLGKDSYSHLKVARKLNNSMEQSPS